MMYFSLFGLFGKIEKPAQNPAKTQNLSYAREFARALDIFVDDSRAYERGEISEPPKPFYILVVNGAKPDLRLFEGLAPIGKAPWYFLGALDFVNSVEARLKENAEKLGAPIRFGRGRLYCLRRNSAGYEHCSLDDYVRADAPGNDFRLSALPPTSAYMTYYPDKAVNLDVLTEEVLKEKVLKVA